MTKFLDGIYKYFSYIIILLSLVAYLAYQTLVFEGSIKQALIDPQTWVHTLFVIWIQVNAVSAAFDAGVSTGVSSKEFELADKLNNKLINSVNNEMEAFRKYIKALNDHELQNIREDYLFKVGDKKVEELTKKERKKYNNLQPIRHDIYGFNLPLYYEMSKNGTIKYQAFVRKNQGKLIKQAKKIFSGVLFAGMTFNMAFSLSQLGPAFISLAIIFSGLIITYLMNYVPQVYKFKVELPKKVILKNTIYNSFIDFKNGSHVLKKLKLEDEPVIQEKQVIQKNTDPVIGPKVEVVELPLIENKPINTQESKDKSLTERPASPQFDTLKNEPLGI